MSRLPQGPSVSGAPSRYDYANGGDFNVIRAEAVFIAGGDQSNDVDFWKGTPVEIAIAGRVTTGGTSAGLAVMCEFVYTGQNGSVLSSEALANPTTGA